MSFLSMDEDRARSLLARRLTGASDADVEAWLAIEPRGWVLEHGPALHAAGLSAQDAADLYRRLGAAGAASLSRLIDQGRMADIDIRYVHLWAASGLLRVEVEAKGRPGRARTPNFTRWITQARLYIAACAGDQHLAAWAAAAGLAVEETASLFVSGELKVEGLKTLSALRESSEGLGS